MLPFAEPIKAAIDSLEPHRYAKVCRLRSLASATERREAYATSSLAVYTAVTSGYDEPQPVTGLAGLFVAYMDAVKTVAGWDTRQLRPHCDDANRNAKIYKVLSHRYFPEYKFSLWIDGSVRLNVSPTVLLEQFMKDFDLVVHAHPDRSCIYDEARVCARKRLDASTTIAAQMERYRREAYPRFAGLHENTVILRRHNHRTQAFNELWWDEICRGSRRDQLSSAYVARRVGLKVGYFPGSLRSGRSDYNGLFSIVPHLRPDARRIDVADDRYRT
jgi:hypothetical protein